MDSYSADSCDTVYEVEADPSRVITVAGDCYDGLLRGCDEAYASFCEIDGRETYSTEPRYDGSADELVTDYCDDAEYSSAGDLVIADESRCDVKSSGDGRCLVLLITHEDNFCGNSLQSSEELRESRWSSDYVIVNSYHGESAASYLRQAHLHSFVWQPSTNLPFLLGATCFLPTVPAIYTLSCCISPPRLHRIHVSMLETALLLTAPLTAQFAPSIETRMVPANLKRPRVELRTLRQVFARNILTQHGLPGINGRSGRQSARRILPTHADTPLLSL